MPEMPPAAATTTADDPVRPETTTPDAATPAVGRDFRAAVAELLKTLAGKSKLFWPLMTGGLLLGATGGLFLPSWTALVPAALLVALMIAALQIDQIKKAEFQEPIDWSTAETHRAQATADLPDHVQTMLTQAEATIAARLGAPTTHLLVTKSTSAAVSDAAGLTAGVLHSRTHPVLVVGHLLLRYPQMLQFVLDHEMLHTLKPLRMMRLLLTQTLMFGWVIMGLLTPLHLLPVVAPITLVILLGWQWAEEAVHDAIAARHPQADARAWYIAIRIANRSIPRYRRKWLMNPSHPPLVLRAAITRLLTGRSRRCRRDAR